MTAARETKSTAIDSHILSLQPLVCLKSKPAVERRFSKPGRMIETLELPDS